MADSPFRTAATLEAYQRKLAEGVPRSLRFLAPTWKGKHWFIAQNEYPYDKIAARHDLLCPIRVFAQDWEMTKAERGELNEIRQRIASEGTYDILLENIHHERTVLSHYHLHLIKYKPYAE